MRVLLVSIGLAAAALALAGCQRKSAEEQYDLEIVTPHNDEIQHEFQRGFERSVGHPLKIRWVKMGTGELMQYLAGKDRGPDSSLGYDVFFGGGVPEFAHAAQKGYLEPLTLSAETRAAIPPDIAGVPTADPDGRWVGAALSAFGILVNRQGLSRQGITLPLRTWQELGDPNMFGWVIVADARKSLSVAVAYELILQQHGWEAGWPILMQIFANARMVTSKSTDVPNEVAGGNVLAGPCIDMYALAQIAKDKDHALAYVIPEGGSAITPDPIALLRKPPHRELAEKFIAFVLSMEGQRLWVLPKGAAGGPTEAALLRIPIRPDVLDKYHDQTNVANPYAGGGAGLLRVDGNLQTARTRLLQELTGIALADMEDDLRAAWKALNAGGRKPAALEEWRKLPFDMQRSLEIAKELREADAAGKDAISAVQAKYAREWQTFFRAKYERVIELSR